MAESIRGEAMYVSLGTKKAPAPILRGIDFTAKSGQIVGLCGPNGAGKSTLLRTLAGFIPVVDGGVFWQGQPLGALALRARARMLAFLHQEVSLPFDFAVRDVVRMGRYPYQAALAAPSGEDEAAVERAMAEAGCTELADAPFSRLSGGERQRVMLARVLCQETPLLLLDEPTSSLDIQFAHSLYRSVTQRAAVGGTVVMVLHDLRSAAQACTHLYLMHQGQVVASGEPRQVLTPENLESAYGVSVHTFDNPAGGWDYYLAP